MIGDRLEVRGNLRVYHAWIEGADELAVEVTVLWVDVVVRRSTAIVLLFFHIRRSGRLASVQQGVGRWRSGQDAALEECECE